MTPLHACNPDETGWDYPPEASPLHPASMPIGRPRPTSTDGRRLPVPYIARGLDELGNVEAMRRHLVVTDRRCQVCGERLGRWAVVCWRPNDVIVVDGAAVCVRPCWAQALRLCPHLAGLWAGGGLVVACVPTEQLQQWEPGGSVGDAVLEAQGMSAAYEVPVQ